MLEKITQEQVIGFVNYVCFFEETAPYWRTKDSELSEEYRWDM